MFIQTGSLNRMFQSRLILRNAMSWLALCMGFPAAGFASSTEMDMTANIINNTCGQYSRKWKRNAANGGKNVVLYRGGHRSTSTSRPAGGTRFMIQVVDCSGDESGSDKRCTLPLNRNLPKLMGFQNRYSVMKHPPLLAALKTWGLLFF